MKVVLFNGPPRSGKDTLAWMLATKLEQQHVNIPVRFESISFPLRQIAYATVGYVGDLDGEDYESFKLMEFPELGVNGRQLMISVSEDWLKKKFGFEVMAKMLMARQAYQMFDGLMMIRDSGFQCEVDPLIRRYGAENIYLVRVHREGCDFSNDSREWTHLPKSGNCMDVYNDGTLADLQTEAGRIYGRLVNQMGWRL